MPFGGYYVPESILFPDVISKMTADEKRRLRDVLANFFVELARERLEGK